MRAGWGPVVSASVEGGVEWMGGMRRGSTRRCWSRIEGRMGVVWVVYGLCDQIGITSVSLRLSYFST